MDQDKVKLPGIFNDVIGPVMRGPSSSHTAASWRIANTSLEILNEPLKKAFVEFDSKGAWATNYREQGTAMGIEGGLLGLKMTDPGMKHSTQLAKERGISIQFRISSFPTRHPNTLRLNLEGLDGKSVTILAASLGGGSFEIQQINGYEVDIQGDFFELLLLKKKIPVPDDITESITQNSSLIFNAGSNEEVLSIKSSRPIPTEIFEKIKSHPEMGELVLITPVLPVISGNETELPFSSISSMLDYADENSLDPGDLGVIYEKCLSGLQEEELHQMMENILNIIEKSIATGLEGTDYRDRILQQQSHLVAEAEQQGKILRNSLVNKIIAYVTAIMEAKSAMELIVANPTAGSCGTVGGVLKALGDELGSSREELVKACFAAGIVGAWFAMGPGFSAEEHGCQVECGAASGMAAAGIVQLLGGTARQAIDAASMAIQNMIGLVCDPLADRVEVPCLGKNISAAMNALSSATMACSGFDVVIPLDEVLQTIPRVSAQMPDCVKCTGKGGLSVTETSIRLKRGLERE